MRQGPYRANRAGALEREFEDIQLHAARLERAVTQ